jgi:hypothetical protein
MNNLRPKNKEVHIHVILLDETIEAIGHAREAI